jgi:hypothetical protein
MSRTLVVVADGAGLSAERDAAILEAHDRGVVTEASVVAAGPTAEAFVAAARGRERLGLGLHLDLTDGTSLAGRHFTLTDAAGRFLGDAHETWRRGVMGEVDAAEVERETVAQWRRLEALGARPDHLDSLHHVHVMPAALPGVLRALALVGAPAHVRLPAEADPPADAPRVTTPQVPLGTVVLSKARFAQARAGHGGLATLGAHADTARGWLAAPRWAADAFTGLAFDVEPGPHLAREGLRAAKGAVVEWGVVLAGAEAGAPPPRAAHAARVLAVLVDPATRALVDAEGLRLSTFAAARG